MSCLCLSIFFSDGLIQTTTLDGLLFHRCPRSDYIPILDHSIVLFVTETKCRSMLMKGFMRLIAGFAKVVGAMDGSLLPIITSINASVHPPQETVDRVDPPPPPSNGVTCHLSSFVFLLFLLHSASLCTLYSTLTPMHYYLPLFPMITLIMLMWCTCLQKTRTLSINSTRYSSNGLHRMRCACV